MCIMKISVIIPTYNAETYIALLLEKLQKQSIIFELIIIDSSSTDNTIAIATKYTNTIISIPKKEFDHGGTRTKAAKTASGDIIVFLTQDALPIDSTSIEKLISAFKDPLVAVAYGKQIPYHHTSLFGKHLRIFNYSDTSYTRTLNEKKEFGIKTAFLSDSFAAYRKSDLEAVKWFKSGLIVGEDMYVGAKLLLAGKKLAYVAEAKVFHSHSYSIHEEFKRYFDTGVYHKQEKWLINTFGKAEGEGKKYILSEFNYIIENNAYQYIPEFFLRNMSKYLGYKLGQQYKYYPKRLIKYFSLHPLWWEE